MSKITRKVYQEKVEENKRLLRDLKIITTRGLKSDTILLIKKYRDQFEAADRLNEIISFGIKAYFKKNPNDPAVKFVLGLEK